jgi:hypothetical protein
MALLSVTKLKRLLTLGSSSRDERLRRPSSLCDGSRHSSSSGSLGSGCDLAAKALQGPVQAFPKYAGHTYVSERWGECEGDELRVQFALVQLERPGVVTADRADATDRVRQSFGDSFLLTVCLTGRGVGTVALDPEQREVLLETGAGESEVVGFCLQRMSDVPKDVREGVDSVFHALQRFSLPARLPNTPLELGSARVFLLDVTTIPHDEVALGKLEASQLLVQQFRGARSRAAVARGREMDNIRLIALMLSQQRR